MFEQLPPDVTLYEVGPRDGLQNESRMVPTYDKIRLTLDDLGRLEEVIPRGAAAGARYAEGGMKTVNA